MIEIVTAVNPGSNAERVGTDLIKVVDSRLSWSELRVGERQCEGTECGGGLDKYH